MKLLDALHGAPILGIFRGLPRSHVLSVASAAANAGLRVVEITMDSENAAAQISDLRAGVPKGVLVGAGTVTSLDRLDDAVEAGAQFLVSPVTDERVMARAAECGLQLVPGAFTPTEVFRAHDAGAELVKLFPSGPVGPGYIRALIGPVGNIPLLCTGSITSETAISFLEAGAKAVGMGGELFGREPDFDDPLHLERIGERIRELLNKLPS
jgi:2-dehydro-3-deoxyphosphogluconate aldolase/(4S)-4-hydroxy-2-oxoglutarate aldolase